MLLFGCFLGSCLAGPLPRGAVWRLSTGGPPILARRLPLAPRAGGALRRRAPAGRRRCGGDGSAAHVRAAAVPDEGANARQYFAKTIREARKTVPGSRMQYIDIRPWLVLLACFLTYTNTALICRVLAFLGGVAIVTDPLLFGIAYGLLGGAILRRTEVWRRECKGEGPELLDESMWKQACSVNNDELLEKGILLGMAPVSVPAWFVLGDISFGERSVSIVTEQCSDLQKALLQITGSIASCSLVHGVIQQALLAQFSFLANRIAISSVPVDPSAEWWWPLVASGPALAPLAAALATAFFEFSVYLIACETLLPAANYEARACQEAIATERSRCERMFTLMGVSREAASLRAEVFGTLADQWEGRRQECRRRRQVTNFVRVLTAAVVYAASGGSILAPVLTNVAVNDSVLGIFSGKSWPK